MLKDKPPETSDATNDAQSARSDDEFLRHAAASPERVPPRGRDLEPRALLGHFRLLVKIGEGGMGVVYKATDEKLRRTVALKVLPDSLANDEERRRRMLREARAAAAVTHPNIATVHEIGESDDGRVFIAMEFVEGQSLRSLLAGRALARPRAIAIALQIARALAKAHQSNVVHRDLKPENVVVDAEDHVKVLDFGLAKLLEPELSAASTGFEHAPTESATHEGRILGTPRYMSPEQARGKEVTTKSDVFSFGIVLYEMLSGKAPFAGDSMTDVLTAITRDEPEPLSSVDPGLPRDVEALVARCLEKQSDARCDATEVVQALEKIARGEPGAATSPSRHADKRSLSARIGIVVALLGLISVGTMLLRRTIFAGRRPVSVAGSTSAGAASAGFMPAARVAPSAVASAALPADRGIAVLPFVNMSNEPANEYFSDGMTEELLDALSHVAGLRVVARTSVFALKGKASDVREVGTRLGVSHVVEGSVRKAGNRLRITAQLVQTSDGYRVWSETYERELKDVFKVQEELAHAIAGALTLHLSPDARAHVPLAYAHDAYLRGRFQQLKGTEDGFKKAIDHYKTAARLDPAYAAPWVGMAESYITYADQYLPPKKAYPLAREAAMKAIEIAPNEPGGHVFLGMVLLIYDWDFAAGAAEDDLGRKLGSDADATLVFFSANYPLVVRSLAEGLAGVKHALAMDPLNPFINHWTGHLLVWDRQYDEAIRQEARTAELDADMMYMSSALGDAYREKGVYDKAIAEYQREEKLLGKPSMGLAIVYARSGRPDEARAIESKLEALRAKGEYVAADRIAAIWLALGDKDRAFEWLDKAIEERDTWLTWIRTLPEFDPIRDDPRYAGVLRRIGWKN